MGRLAWGQGGGGTTLPCMAGSGCKSSESCHLSDSGEERGHTWELDVWGVEGWGA